MLPLPTLLLTTKLHRPAPDENWVARPELLARLQNGLTSKLILISAPPGFGKTTLASQWVASSSLASAWLSLDEGDNHVAHFLRYFVAAIQTCLPAACPTTQSLLTAPNLPNADYLADVLVSELTALSTPLLLVLDDYHAIRASDVHRLMRHVLRYRPAALHLVILSRTDPPLHLGRLRIEQQITELRARDLRFALAETRRFLEVRVDQPLDDEALQTLHARSEGWITGLQLACISLQHQNLHEFLVRFHGNDRLLSGYLVEEVLARQTEAMQEFLLRTACVDRFCAPLADALWEYGHTPAVSRALIAALEDQNLFVIPLDDEGTWYRYHDLFRDFLRQRLKREVEPAKLALLHHRASVWLAEAGLIEDALRHALAAGEVRFAADLVEAHFHPMLNRRSPMHTLARWLDLFDEKSTQNHAGLLIAQAALAAYGMRPPVQLDHFTQIETLLTQDATLDDARRQSLEADLNLMRGIYAYAHDEPEVALAYFEQAVAAVPSAHEFVRALAFFNVANMRACLGDSARGQALLDAAAAEELAKQRPTVIMFLGALATLQVYAAELPAALQTIGRVLAEAAAHQALPSWQEAGYADIWLGRALHLRGVIAYEQNDLAAAAQYWSQLEPLRYRTHPAPFHDSLVGRALLAQAQGAPGEARAFAQAARQFAVETHSADLQAKSAALDARLALLAGDLKGALECCQSFGVTANQGSAFGLTLPALTRVHVLLADASPDSLATALALCEACRAHAGKMHNNYQTIQATAMQAVALHKAGRSAQAHRALAQSLRLGEPGGFLHTFLELGTPMAALLRAHRTPRDQAHYVKHLLAVFDDEQAKSQRHRRRAQSIKRHGVTPLTRRELEVLKLNGDGLTIEEIAARLVISPNTVKKHTNNIYTKLGVHNGRQALAKAQDLGLLRK